MIRPELYQISNSAPRDDALEALQKFKTEIKWNPGDSVIDLGCGDGNLTVNILKKRMPSNFKKLIGADISKKMINFAANQFSDDKTSFCVLDIGGDILLNLSSSFNHVFSFYAIHWIKNQEKVFRNVYKLLVEGGDCLLVFPAITPIHDIYRMLARHTKWRQLLADHESYVSPYHDIEEPAEMVQNIMRKANFNNIKVCCEKKFYVNELLLFRTTMQAICPFAIPNELIEEFMDDYMKLAENLGMFVVDDRGHTCVELQYTLITAYGRK